MKKIMVGVLAACTLLSVSACSTLGPLIGRLEQDMQEDAAEDLNAADTTPVKDDTDTGKILIDAIQKYYRENAFHASKDTVFKLAELGNDAGMSGAVQMILSRPV